VSFLNRRPVLCALTPLLVAAVVGCASPNAAQSGGGAGADLILENGRVYTVDANRSWAEAVAVKDGKIVYVGTTQGAAPFRTATTRRVDLKGRMMLPGFSDTHNHTYLRAENLFWVTLPAPPTLESYRQAIQDYLAKNPNAKQVRGVGWNMNFVLAQAAAQGKTPATLLDELVGRDIPAVIITHGHHQIWVNSRAIRNAGVTKDTPNPPGALIRRVAGSNEPNGVLEEFGAQNLIIAKLPEPDFTVDEFKTALVDWQRNLAPQRGVTSVLVPTHYPTPNFLTALQSLSDAGQLTSRFDVAQWADETRGVTQVSELVANRARFRGGPYYKVNTIKIFATGNTGGATTSLIWKQDDLNQTIAALDKAGFRVFIHDIGPTETYVGVLDAYEYTFRQNGRRDSRHMITHVGTPAAPLAGRFASLGIRADSQRPLKAMYDAGVINTISSDYPVTDFQPTGEIARGLADGIPLDALIAAHTIRGAEATFSEKETGSIEVGKAADLVVLDQNLFDMPPAEVGKARPVMTLFAGRELFRDSSF
jgi:predicted amidohydrolase YtcJ